ncbi:hypothetical protein [Candidatus Accumulibacter cognatus]|uniref:Uncharacterized protein n=1 Tax=Candidatus Accumulibacter cognatus TaxID=2954383 RepID=A0A080MJ15_9PROT|nr:hypothetical protein [Candidatus Accumulibacter cognatus]KFB77214.1 MAG: hypothetical protein AW06_001628 [Candidatus Accumulibacter cognatus]
MKSALASLCQRLMIVGTTLLVVNSVAAASFLPSSARVDKGLTLYLPSPVKAAAIPSGTHIAGDRANFLGQLSLLASEPVSTQINRESVPFDSKPGQGDDNATDGQRVHTRQSDIEPSQADFSTPAPGHIDSSHAEYVGLHNTLDITMQHQVIPGSGQDGESSSATALAIVVLLLGGLGYAQLQGRPGKPQKRRPLFPA